MDFYLKVCSIGRIDEKTNKPIYHFAGTRLILTEQDVSAAGSGIVESDGRVVRIYRIREDFLVKVKIEE